MGRLPGWTRARLPSWRWAAARPRRPGASWRESGAEARTEASPGGELRLKTAPVCALKVERRRGGMCGRTSCHLPRDALTRACAYRDRRGQPRLPAWRHPDRYRPSYNRSPQSDSPVLLSRLHFEKVTAVPAFSASYWPLAGIVMGISFHGGPLKHGMGVCLWGGGA